MNWRHGVWIVLFAAVLSKAWGQWEHRAVHPADGAIAPDEPLQADAKGAPAVVLGRWTLAPRATYDITARILGREDYRFDPIADLAPLDLALGWGPMSDSAMLARFKVTQGARFYSLYPQDEAVDLALALRHSANMHLIPASGTVRSTLESARAGQVVSLRGQLVDAARPDGFSWRTSLTREDTGAGACELVYVESAALR